LVLFAHGIESHTGWFEATASRLAEAGYPVVSMDRRGWGKSQGIRGHVESMEAFLIDIELLTTSQRAGQNGRPLVGLGLSLGGLLTTALAMKRPGLFQGVVCAVPAIATLLKPRWFQILRAIFDNAIDPKRLHPLPIRLDMFTDVPEAAAYIEGDAFRTREVSARFFFCLRDMRTWVCNNPEKMTTPLLTLLAEKDEIIDNQGVRHWQERVTGCPALLKEYAGVKHSILMEPCRDEVLEDIKAFLGQVEEKCAS
jgi:alpha-beta hydrolase superfamily lysophospholipase